MKPLLLLLISINPVEDTASQHVDVLEVNSFHADDGTLTFKQLIAWERVEGVLRVVGWRLVKNDSMIPQRDFARGGWFCHFNDIDGLRTIRATSVRHTWTQPAYEGDPEVENQQYWPKENRRGLVQRKEPRSLPCR